MARPPGVRHSLDRQVRSRRSPAASEASCKPGASEPGSPPWPAPRSRRRASPCLMDMLHPESQRRPQVVAILKSPRRATLGDPRRRCGLRPWADRPRPARPPAVGSTSVPAPAAFGRGARAVCPPWERQRLLTGGSALGVARGAGARRNDAGVHRRALRPALTASIMEVFAATSGRIVTRLYLVSACLSDFRPAPRRHRVPGRRRLYGFGPCFQRTLLPGSGDRRVRPPETAFALTARPAAWDYAVGLGAPPSLMLPPGPTRLAPPPATVGDAPRGGGP